MISSRAQGRRKPGRTVYLANSETQAAYSASCPIGGNSSPGRVAIALLMPAMASASSSDTVDASAGGVTVLGSADMTGDVVEQRNAVASRGKVQIPLCLRRFDSVAPPGQGWPLSKLPGRCRDLTNPTHRNYSQTTSPGYTPHPTDPTVRSLTFPVFRCTPAPGLPPVAFLSLSYNDTTRAALER